MAFFGLTALGPQNSFAAAALKHRYLQIFEESDFQQAWRAINGERSFCPKSKISDIMEALFRGPVPKYDLDPVLEAFHHINDGSGMIAFATFLKIMAQLQREAENDELVLEGKPKPECEFTSSQQFQEARRKNAAMKENCQNKLSIPVTSAQQVIVICE
jgi:hypothetical protein